jgi:hypothetical protein
MTHNIFALNEEVENRTESPTYCRARPRASAPL